MGWASVYAVVEMAVSPLALESIGMLGFVTNVAGNMLLTRKNQHGWWIRIVSNALWTVYAGTSASFSLNVNHIVFFVINVYGWWRWSKDQTPSPSPE